jgi:hypothetical protein
MFLEASMIVGVCLVEVLHVVASFFSCFVFHVLASFFHVLLFMFLLRFSCFASFSRYCFVFMFCCSCSIVAEASRRRRGSVAEASRKDQGERFDTLSDKS